MDGETEDIDPNASLGLSAPSVTATLPTPTVTTLPPNAKRGKSRTETSTTGAVKARPSSVKRIPAGKGKDKVPQAKKQTASASHSYVEPSVTNASRPRPKIRTNEGRDNLRNQMSIPDLTSWKT